MLASLRAFLSGIIDYAGLFPPAQLPLDQAIRNYARYRTEPEGWMLGRFVCPAARLAELAPFHAELFQTGPPFVLAVAGRGGGSWEELLTSLHTDLEALAAFQEHHGGRVVVDVYEVRLPEPSIYPLQQTLTGNVGLGSVIATLEVAGPRGLTPYFEMPPISGWREALLLLTDALWAYNRSFAQPGTSSRRCRPGGLKLRCGGLKASAFPAPEQVAYTLTRCRDLGLTFKATAGLHHPVRRFDPGVQTHMHGFLNVFGAGVLAHARRLSEEQVRQIIEEEDTTSFVFDDAGFRWKDWHATTDEIAAARQRLVTSFGSCSFDEPRDDLRAMGLLP